MKGEGVITLVIADDHEIFRQGLKLVLRNNSRIKVVGEAANGKELIDVATRLKPDVVLTDLIMPEINGIEATKEILFILPETKVIALSVFDEESLVVQILEAGGLGYLLKNAGKREIMEAIESVYNGDPYYCEAVSAALIKSISASNFNPYTSKPAASFTSKELEVIRFICEQHTSKEIGENLFVSTRTVEWYRKIIMEKMRVKGTAGIVIYAIKNNIFKI